MIRANHQETPPSDEALAGLNEVVHGSQLSWNCPECGTLVTSMRLPAVQTEPDLDVETLATAIKRWYGTPIDISTNAPDASARWIAAEYDRLRSIKSRDESMIRSTR